MESQLLKELKAKDLARLMAPAPDKTVVVTLIMPMERKGAETRKNPITFKNALKEAQDQLEAHWPEKDKLKRNLGGLKRHHDVNADLWQHQDKGLIMVIPEEGEPESYSLPFAPEPFVHIGTRAHLLPLLELAGGNEFYVLILDLNELQLLRSTCWKTERIPLKNMPCSLAEAMKFDDPEKSLQFRRVTATNLPGAGAGDVAFHGHGITGDEEQNKRIRRFFEQFDNGLPQHFDDRELPLALFGPESEVGLFRELNHYPHLYPEAMVCNLSHLTSAEIERRIRDWIAERDAESRRKAIEDLKNQLGRDLATTDLEEVSRAAIEGRLASLFIQAGACCYGSRDGTSGSVCVHDARQNGDQELISELAVAAAETGSDLYYLDPRAGDGNRLPGDAQLAAVFRY